MPVETITSTVQIGYAKVTFKSDKHHHELLDTEVLVGGVYLCSICGCYISMFIEDFKNLVQKYRV